MASVRPSGSRPSRSLEHVQTGGMVVQGPIHRCHPVNRFVSRRLGWCPSALPPEGENRGGAGDGCWGLFASDEIEKLPQRSPPSRGLAFRTRPSAARADLRCCGGREDMSEPWLAPGGPTLSQWHGLGPLTIGSKNAPARGRGDGVDGSSARSIRRCEQP